MDKWVYRVYDLPQVGLANVSFDQEHGIVNGATSLPGTLVALRIML